MCGDQRLPCQSIATQKPFIGDESAEARIEGGSVVFPCLAVVAECSILEVAGHSTLEAAVPTPEEAVDMVAYSVAAVPIPEEAVGTAAASVRSLE